jgi:hypothetical protein
LVVEGVFSDESVRELAPDEYALDPPDTALDGAKQVTVRAGDFSAWFPVMVNSSSAVLQSITLTRPPDKTVYALGEFFDKTGMVVTGRYYDSEEGAYVEHSESVYEVSFDRTLRGEQEAIVRVNRATASLPVELRIPADAKVSLNTTNSNKSLNCQQIWIKGETFDMPDNLDISVSANGVTVWFMDGEGVSPGDFFPLDTGAPGAHALTLTLDDATVILPVYVADLEPELFFDYGYWRHAGNPRGTAPGGAEHYTAPQGRPLALAPILNLVTEARFSWEVAGGAHTATGHNSEIFVLTPEAPGNYTVTVTVEGTAAHTGAALSMTATTTVVCLPPLPAAPPDPVENPLFVPPLRNFSPGQFTMQGTGFGWSLGSVLGYEVWRWRVSRETDEFHIYGNAFAGWEEPGIVWVMCDENNNGLPDDTWYELKGSDDESEEWRPQITRRYAINWFDPGDEAEENEYGQLISNLVWVDSLGRRGFMNGGWPSVWGVETARVTFCGTMIRDPGAIYGGGRGQPRDVAWGYVDAGDLTSGPYADQNGKFFVSNAIQRDGSPVDLPWIDFVKVQTGVFYYGTVVGEISTEIYSADGLGKQTDFPLP